MANIRKNYKKTIQEKRPREEDENPVDKKKKKNSKGKKERKNIGWIWLISLYKVEDNRHYKRVHA